jgi:hypothetical protein
MNLALVGKENLCAMAHIPKLFWFGSRIALVLFM